NPPYNPYKSSYQRLQDKSIHQTHQTTYQPIQNPTRISNVNRPVNPCAGRDLRFSRAVNTFQVENSPPADLVAYLEVCERGAFYESLMTDEERAKGKKHRARLKVRFYGVLFGRNKGRGHPPSETRRRFRQRYPTVAGVLKDLKRKNYKHSSHVL